MAGTIKGIIVEIGGDTSGLQKALKSVNSVTSSLSKELRGVNSLLKLDPSNTELVAQKQTILAKNIQETSEKLDLLKNTQKQAEEAMANGTEISEENYRNLQREIISTENKLKELQLEASDWTQAGKKLEEFGNKVTDISSKIDNLGSTLTTTLTLPVLAIGTAAVTTGNSFEAQMSRVQAIAGATKDELEQLTNQAIDLGAETTFSASEVASGMENLASAGFTVQEIMDAMPGLLNLAASSGAELATSSEIAASAIRGFGLEASQSSHVADVFAEAAARTNAQTEDMGEAMKYVAPVAKTVGLSLEETAAAIGIMSDAGIKGSQAGTTLRSGLTRIVKPTKQVKEAMEQLDVEFYNSDGTMKSLTEIIGTLQEHTEGLTDEVKNQALAQIFGTEALSGMLALVNRGSDDLSDMTKEFEEADGAAEDIADTMLDNTSGALESLSGSFESAGIAIQKALAPEIKDLAKWIQDLVDDFNDLTDEEKQNIIKTALLVAAIGPAIKILGTLGTGIGTVTKGFGTLSQAIGVFRTGATSANTTANILAKGISALTSPVGLTVTSVAALTGAIIYFEQSAKKIPSALQESMDEMKEYTEEHRTFREELDKSTASSMSEISHISNLKDELATLVDENGKVKESYEGRVSFILNELNSALGTEYSMTGDIINNYQNLQDEIDTLILKKKAQILLENEEEKFSKAIQNKGEAYETLIKAQEEYNNALEGKTYQQYFDDLKKYYEDMGYTAEASTKYAQEYMAKWIDGYKQNYEDAKTVYSDYLNDIATYESDFAIIQSNNNEEIQKLIQSRTFTYEQSSNDIGETINHNIQQVQFEIQQYQKSYEKDLENQDTYNAQKNQAQVEAGQKQLQNLADQLVAMTSTTTELTPQQLEAWQSLADNSYGIYSSTLSKLSPEMQTKIEEATGVLMVEGPKMADKAGIVGEMVIENFDKNTEAKEEALAMLQSYYEGLTDEEKQQLLTETVGDLADDVAEEFESGDYETSGKNVLEGIYTGLSNKTLGENLIDKAAGIAKNIANQFNIQWDEHSPSKLMKKKAEYFLQPISTVFSKQQNKLTSEAKKVAMGIVQGFDSAFSLKNNFKIPNINSINGEIKKQTKMIYTTPTLNIYTQGEVNIRKIADEVNRIFGSKY